jgi:hypothetical protein
MDEQKIREAAYRLWEKQGKPQGQDLEHWFTAEQSADKDDAESSASEPSSSSENREFSGDNPADSIEDQQGGGR